MKYVSAMEQELARSIMQINSIKNASGLRPQRRAFWRTELSQGVGCGHPPLWKSGSNSQAEAIVHMVSSSIPHLDSENVVVVDQRGNLLTDSNRLPGMQMSTIQIEQKRIMEETYRTRIDALLSPIVGEENLRAEVDVQLDFTQVESTFEEYDGNDNGPKPRSESTTIRRDSSKDAMGVLVR